MSFGWSSDCRTLNWHQQKIAYTQVLASLHWLPENFSLNFLGPSWSQPQFISDILKHQVFRYEAAAAGHIYSVQN